MTLELLVPLGLLGLIGIAVLILIYVIRPNYQAKHVTSTYIWKLSLNYRRRRPPVNKIRNIIIFICQLLILTAMALIMAWPSLVERSFRDDSDIICIVDSSASMYTQSEEGVTRFDRALDEVRARADKALAEGGKVTVIVADDAPYYLEKRMDTTRRTRLMNELDELSAEGSSYSVADIEGALTLGRDVLLENPSAKLYVITDTTYGYVPEGVEIVPVLEDEEWNAAILDATAVREDGYYQLTVKVACYGVSSELQVSVHVEGANAIPAADIYGEPIEFSKYVDCADDAVKTVIFRVGGGADDENLFYYDVGDAQKFFSYSSIQIGIEADDSYSVDNNFFLYGGLKERLRVEYYSSDPNPFIQTAIAQARNALADNYDLDVHEVKKGDEPILDGFDLYIFEHRMPSRIPTDGAVILLDPRPSSSFPITDAGFRIDQDYIIGESVTLAEGEDYEGSPVTQYVIADDIEVSRYDILSDLDPSYEVLLSYDNNPMLMVRNDEQFKIAVMAFSVHYSNIAKLPENFLIMYGIIGYFYPSIISGNAFEVNESFTLDTWGPELTFKNDGTVFQADELPKAFSLDKPGTYVFEQTSYYGKETTMEVFIKPPAAESDIRAVKDSISDPYEGTEKEDIYRDLLLILASILVGLLFAEWILQSRENK